MTFIVATNVIASGPPERRPTGTPHTRANITLIAPHPTTATQEHYTTAELERL